MKQLSRDFWYLNAAVFAGAFNDNFFKMMLIVMITFTAPADQQALLTSLAGGLFVLPFLLVSSFAGWLADRFSKSRVTFWLRGTEPFLIIAGCWFLYLESLNGLLVVLFAFGLQSAVFSPSKYGIIAEIVPKKQLTKANGYIELFTFAGILIGTALPGQISRLGDLQNLLVGIILLSVSLIGWLAVSRIRPTQARNPDCPLKINPVQNLRADLREIRKNRPLFLSLLGNCWFWFIAVLFQLSIFIYASQVLQFNENQTSFLVTSLMFGIGVGSILAGLIAANRVELGTVPLSALAMSLCCFLLGFFPGAIAGYEVLAHLVFLILGVCAGLYMVPLNTFFQAKCPEDLRGSYLASANILFNIAILFGSGFLWVYTIAFNQSITSLYLAIAIATLFVAVLAFRAMPDLVLRFINLILTRSIYKLKISGQHNIPDTAGALLVSNHVSYVDAMLLVSAAGGRPIRFIMLQSIYNLPLIKYVCGIVDVIPISPGSGGEHIAEVLNKAKAAVNNNELVCIFAEGGLTRDGEIAEFRTGLETIMSGSDRPIIPVHLDGLWGSMFSNTQEKSLRRMATNLPYPVRITFGTPLPASSSAQEVRAAVVGLTQQ